MISVIIVNWNGKHHLKECLDSLRQQTYKDFEGQKLNFAKSMGIHQIPAHHYLDIDVQVIELNKLNDEKLKKSEEDFNI